MQEKLLVVDDERDLCEILKFNLECEGFRVDTALSAEEALTLLPRGYDLLLLDVMMEGLSGFQLAERLRKGRYAQLPIIFLTARDAEGDLLTGFEVGGDDYIPKPFSVKEVVVRVRAVLKRTVRTPSPVVAHSTLAIGELVINTEAKRVTLHGESISLTKKEFEILWTLANNPNKVFSREEILQKVWRGESFVLERTIDVHITRLRKKLGAFGDRLTNRSGYGYCLECGDPL